MSSTHDDGLRLIARIAEDARELEQAKADIRRLEQENAEQEDRIYSLQCAAIVGGLSVQARSALLLVERYMREDGDDLTSERVRAAVLEAISVTAKAAEIQAASEAA